MRWSASKLSRFCAHSHVLADLNPRPTRDAAAKKGTEFHAALEEWWKTGVVPGATTEVVEWLETMLDHGWNWPDGAQLEVSWGLNSWGMCSAVEEPSPHVYKSLDGEELITAGRIDCVWPMDDLLVVIDFKTGRTLPPRAAENLQVNAAGIALAQRFKVSRYQPGIYHARSGTWDMGDPVDDWTPMLEEIRAAAALDEKPHPGPHCSDCWERRNCSEAA